MKVKFCPRCKSSNIIFYAGGLSGTFKCNNCGYIGSLIIEKDFVKTLDDEEYEEKQK